MRRRVTITAIAREAGVSVPTVSRVINGRSDVSPQTRERVEELLRQHGYRRRTGPAPASSGLIDLVFNDWTARGPSRSSAGWRTSAHAAGVGTVVSAIHRQHLRGQAVAAQHAHPGHRRRHLRDLRLEPPLQAELRRLDVPVVVVDPAGVPRMDAPTIGATNWAGGLARPNTCRLGHRRIGFIAGPRSLLCSRARLDGYRAGLDAAGIALDDS